MAKIAKNFKWTAVEQRQPAAHNASREFAAQSISNLDGAVA
jgi:hypothetical protein